ncbi:MAG: hypothetical protein M1548_09330 [Actinobacteria bacterium]|nr:hypothetical protein [Actinomycetota bacterium]
MALVYVDLCEGLDLYREGDVSGAIIGWLMAFEFRWGLYATDALYRAHVFCLEKELDELLDDEYNA